MNILPLLAEFIGTFALLTSILFTGNWLVIGSTLAGVVFLLGNISGAHVNPAVSLAMYMRGSLNAFELSTYSVAQILAAVASVYVYNYVQ
jgi:aquaporin Z